LPEGLWEQKSAFEFPILFSHCREIGYSAVHASRPVFTTIEQGLVIRVMGHLSVADIKTL